MKLKVMLDPGAKMPTRAHKTDAGLDLYSTRDVTIMPYGISCIDTGVHAQIPPGYVGDIDPKSGLMQRHRLFTFGTIDCEYTGPIHVVLFNASHEYVKISAGQKIAQLVIKACITPETELVDHLEETDRGAGGFGSTGDF